MSLGPSFSPHPNLSIDSLSELGSLKVSSLTDGDLVYVRDVDQYWRLSLSSSAPVSGSVRTSAMGGRWLLCSMTDSSTLYTLVLPTGEPVLDLANVQAAIDDMAVAGSDGVVLLGIGRFRFELPLAMRSNVSLMGLSKNKTILEFNIDGTTVADCGIVAARFERRHEGADRAS